MPLSARTTDDGQTLLIAISGRFDFSLYNEFRRAYEGCRTLRCVIDLKETEYIDSSALGMLLVFRERNGGDSSDISIINSRPAIREILRVSNFDKLFTIR